MLVGGPHLVGGSDHAHHEDLMREKRAAHVPEGPLNFVIARDPTALPRKGYDIQFYLAKREKQLRCSGCQAIIAPWQVRNFQKYF